MTESDELLDLVDATDTVIGTIRRGDTPTLVPGAGKYIRSINIFIQRSTGEIWVPKRSAVKTSAANGLDYSIGGHVNSTESYLECAVREAVEEASFQINPTELTLIKRSTPQDYNATYFDELYYLKTDVEPQLGEEHISGEWMHIDTLITLLRNGTKAKSSLLRDCLLLKDFLLRD